MSGRYPVPGVDLDEKVEGEQGQTEKQQDRAPAEATARELDDRMNKTNRDYAKARFAAAFIERAGWNVAGQVAPEEGEFVVHPEKQLGAVTPKGGGPQDKCKITQKG